MGYKFLVVFVIGFSLLLGFLSSQGDSPTNDEIAHIGAGYSYLIKQNMRLNPEHPPLVKDLAAVPLLFLNFDKEIFKLPGYWTGDIRADSQWTFGHILIFKAGVSADKVLQLARLPMFMFFVLSASLIFIWGRKLYGDKAGIIALIIFAFSPTVIAHSKLVTSDIAVTFIIFLSTYLFIKYLENRSTKNLLIAALSLGAALGIKFSSLLLLPFFLLLSLAHSYFKKEPVFKSLGSALAVIFIGVSILVPIYYLNIYNYPPSQQKQDSKIILDDLERSGFIANKIIQLADKPILRLPAHYLLGLEMVRDRVSGSEDIYFLDKVQKSGSLIYFPFLYLVKEPISWLVLLVIALVLFFKSIDVGRFKEWGRNNFVEFALVLWVFIYLTASIKGNLNIGIRHLLPIYPFIILIISGLIANKFKQLRFVVYILLFWYLLEALFAFPNYISYYSPIAGGSANGYKYAVDSNLDWGQDLKRLGQWANEHKVEKIELDYFGWAAPEYYLGDKFIPVRSDKYKNIKDFVSRSPTGGLLAVSATTLFQESYKSYAWLRPYAPTAVVGNSIYIWYITPQSIDKTK